MKLARSKIIAIVVIVFGLLGGAFWVSQVTYRGDESIPALTSSSAPIPPAVPPKPIFVVIASPTNRIVGFPVIQLKGYSLGDIVTINYDLVNSESCRTNQRNYFISRGGESEEVNTNHFECSNIPLANGTNTIDLHTIFYDGRTFTNHITYVLDSGSWTNPPEIKILWPSNDTSIAGSMFTLQAQVADPTTTIHVSMFHRGAPPLEFDDAIVERDGRVIAKDLPLADGTNMISVIVRDAAGNSSTTNLGIYGSTVKITMRPLKLEMLNKQLATVSGTISNPGLTVKVNGQLATVFTNSQWKADNVTLEQRRFMPSFKRGAQRFGYRSNVILYFTVSAFKEKAVIATQRFEVSP